jgi:hypothetical protein
MMEIYQDIQDLRGKIQALEARVNDLKAIVMNFKTALDKIDEMGKSADWNYKQLCKAFNLNITTAFDNQKQFFVIMKAAFEYMGISTPLESWMGQLKGPTLMGIIEKVGLEKSKQKRKTGL